MTTRRGFLIAIGPGALAIPFGSIAQQPGRVWRIGYLWQRDRPSSLETGSSGAFLRGLRDLRYVEGRNLAIEWRFADYKVERFPALAADLVNLKVDVILAAATPAATAAQKATTVIPIVMVGVGDPVGSGLVKSLARPGGNITGLTNISAEFGPKHLEMLHGMVPKLSRVAVLVNPDNSSHAVVLKEVQSAARSTGVTILPVEARTASEIEKAFSAMARERAGALILARDPLFNQHAHQLADLAARARLPTVAGILRYAEAGGLMSYGSSTTDQYRRAATYVDRIFKGAKPADLPVEQPVKFELVLNVRAAKALGLTIPQSLLISADRVIE